MKFSDILNLFPSKEDSRDLIAKYFNCDEEKLPVKVDLMPDVEEIENQYDTNSCTANAAATALEIMYKRAGIKIDFSRMYIYWHIRQLGKIRGDVGGYPRDIGKALAKYGACEEKDWEFNESNLHKQPSEELVKKALQHKIDEYSKISAWTNEGLVKEIKTYLANGIPVLVTMKNCVEFKNSLFGNSWREHIWFPYIRNGAHQVLFIGYDDTAQRFLGANSWGPKWGDGGFFGAPYSMVGSNQQEFFEFWVFTKTKVKNVKTY